jgi:hypothetical protein
MDALFADRGMLPGHTASAAYPASGTGKRDKLLPFYHTGNEKNLPGIAEVYVIAREKACGRKSRLCRICGQGDPPADILIGA